MDGTAEAMIPIGIAVDTMIIVALANMALSEKAVYWMANRSITMVRSAFGGMTLFRMSDMNSNGCPGQRYILHWMHQKRRR